MPRKKTAAFKCGKCGKTFAMPMHLGRHMTTMHGQAAKAPEPKKAAERAAPIPQDSTTDRLVALIHKLQAKRQEYLDAIAQIDATFEQFGIAAAPAKRRGRPPKAAKGTGRNHKAATTPVKKGKRRARRTFTMSGLDSVLGFVKKAGKNGATTKEIVKHWKSEGRSGDGYTALSLLVTTKKLKKEKIEGAKGSRYTAI